MKKTILILATAIGGCFIMSCDNSEDIGDVFPDCGNGTICLPDSIYENAYDSIYFDGNWGGGGCGDPDSSGFGYTDSTWTSFKDSTWTE